MGRRDEDQDVTDLARTAQSREAKVNADVYWLARSSPAYVFSLARSDDLDGVGGVDKGVEYVPVESELSCGVLQCSRGDCVERLPEVE